MRYARTNGDDQEWSGRGLDRGLCRHLGRHVGRSCCDYFVNLLWLAHVLELMLAEVGESQFRGQPFPGEFSRGG